MGFPILGDTLYGGTPAPRVYLHAAELGLQHPASGDELAFRAPTGQGWAEVSSSGKAETVDGRSGQADPLPCLALRQALIVPEETDAYRIIHGASDGWPGWYVERLGQFLLSHSTQALSPAQREALGRLAELFSARGAYHKVLRRQVHRTAQPETSPQLFLGDPAPERFPVCENTLSFELSFAEGYSVGLFLDQRDNRRRLLTRHVGADFPLVQPASGNRPWEILNVFAYTCGFSVCAAKAGARTTSLDLSKKCLDWGKRNFALNGLDLAEHQFISGDAFGWLRRLAKQQRFFDVVLLDPPTFSQSKESGVFRAEKDYGRLVTAVLPLLRHGGVLFASTNAADWPSEEFLPSVEQAILATNRKILQRHYVPQPPDFPISRAEPAYLKTVWLRVE
jgi:23S rRNA (cytosine1962-C5)-methyltransferase